MPVERNHQRQRLGSDHFHMVVGGDIRLPERRQMHLFSVEVIAPFIGIVAGQPVASDGVRDGINVIALRGERQFGCGQGSATAGQQLVAQLVLLIEIELDRSTLFVGQLAVGWFDKRQRVRQRRRVAGLEPQVQTGGNQTDKH